MEVSGYLCTLTSAGLVSIESSQNIYIPTIKIICIKKMFKTLFLLDLILYKTPILAEIKKIKKIK